MEHLTFSFIAIFILLFGLVSQRLQTTIISGPMVFTAFGFLLGEQVLSLLSHDLELFHFTAKLTLIILLFSDASRIDLKLLVREHTLPTRLLLIGLPLSIIIGTLCAIVLPLGLNIWEAAILAIILAPTDAALGQAVVSLPIVPVRIRQALNVESGLNDGMVLPILLLAITIASTSGAEASFWLQFTFLQLICGPIVGALVGYLGGKAVSWGTNNHWMNSTFLRLSALGLALLAYGSAELIGGNGFIAAFCAGLALGNSSRSICPRLYEFAETEGQLLTLFTFMLFGSIMLTPTLISLPLSYYLYALLSLTLIRLVPTILSMFGMNLHFGSMLFLGWFGPRGVASILYLFLLLDNNLTAEETILPIVVLTVLASIFLHGATALPFANLYNKHMDNFPEHKEHHQMTEMPVRLPFRKHTKANK